MKRAAGLILLAAGFASCKTYHVADGGPDSTNTELPDGSGMGGGPGKDAASDADASIDAGDSGAGKVVLTIDSTAHDFGMVVTGASSADGTFVVMNTGTVASANLLATLSDPSKAAGYSIKTDHCSGMSLSGGSSCQVVVVLVAASAGSPSGDLTISAGSGVSVAAHLTATAISPGALRISPDTQSFGMVAQNQGSASQTFTITNGGQQATGAMSVALGGTDKAEFQVTADGCSKQTLAVGNGSCQITVRFGPSGLGAKSASLTVSASPGGMAVAQLSGTGITPGTLAITPSMKDFGSVQQMMLGGSQIFSVQNTGQATTGALSTMLSGDDSPNYSILANNCNGHTLATNDTCSVTIQFAPVTPGRKLVSLSVTGATGESGVAQLSGLALANASIAIDPTTKSFNQVTVNQNATATFIVSNGGGVATGLPMASVTGATSADAGQFVVVTTASTCTAAIMPGSNCSITVRFTPTSTGIKNGTLTVTAGTGISATATLTGTGIPPGKLGIGPLNQDFGSLAQGAKGTAVRFTVMNTGASPTGTLQASIVGSTEFQIMGDTCSSMALGVPGSCTVDVVFAPASAAPSGTLQIVATNPADSTSAALSGTGLAPPKLTITPTSASFADTVLNQTAAQNASFTIRNGGGVAAGTGTGLAAMISGTNQADFGIVGSLSNCTGALAAGASCTVVVSFTPKTVGSSKTASLNVTATPGGSAAASLAGNGISAAALGLAPATNNSAAFGNVVAGTPKIQTFVVSNTGQQPTTGLSITLAKSAGPDFTLLTGAANDCAANVAVPGSSSCNLRVQFAPQNRGAQNANLSVSAAVGGAPAGLALSATGQVPAGISANPASVNLGAVTVGVAKTGSVSIINGGDVATSVPTISNGNTKELSVSGCGAALTGTGTTGASCALSLSFTASDVGARSATVMVSVTGSTTMFTVSATAANPCGGTGQACCTGSGITPCSATNLICAAATSTCVACGGSGQPCCGGAGGTCTASGTVCGTSATCVAPTGNGVACQVNAQCASANCTSAICCAAGQSGCSGSCVTLATDNSNCGVCGTKCVLGNQTCTNGVCRGNNGQPCAMPSDCASGICGHWFADGDRDGYGTGTPMGICGAASPPSGFSAVNGDCCDSNASVNPGVTDFKAAAAPSCPGGTMVSPWDWNCNGVVESDFMTALSCGTPAAGCPATIGFFPASECGDPNATPQGCMLINTGIGGLICEAVQNGPTPANILQSGQGGPGVLTCK